MENQIVVFELNSEYFGADIAKVESIIKMQPITQLPYVPTFVEGVTNLRGKVLPVIDLRKRFEILPQQADKDSRIIVVNVNQMEVGMIVDGVSEVLRISDEAVESTPAIVSTVNSAFIKGIVRLAASGSSIEQNQRLVLLLDLAQVLSRNGQANLPLPSTTPNDKSNSYSSNTKAQ